MNEVRDLLIGIDLGPRYSQISCYDRKASEPVSVSVKVGETCFEVPTLLCYRPDKDMFCIGEEAAFFGKEKGGFLIENLYQICTRKDPVRIHGKEYGPDRLLACFLEGLLRFLGVSDVVRHTKCLVLTSPKLTAVQVDHYQNACMLMGYESRKIMLMDYDESFFYYALTQKKETWNRSVGWFAFRRSEVEFRKLSMNVGTRPVLVQLEKPQKCELRKEPVEKDEDFLAFVRKTVGNDLYSSIQITGSGFATAWAKKSVKELCAQKRRVYMGNNLFSKGACAAAVERLENKALKGYRYMGEAMVLTDIGMEMRIMGTDAYYPLIEAGKNWYECRSECELILDQTKELIFAVTTGKEKKYMTMKLEGLPDRPNKTTRLKLELAYVSPKECRLTVTDLGFGDLFPSSGKVWTEKTEW